MPPYPATDRPLRPAVAASERLLRDVPYCEPPTQRLASYSDLGHAVNQPHFGASRNFYSQSTLGARIILDSRAAWARVSIR